MLKVNFVINDYKCKPKIANYKFTTLNPNLGVTYDNKEITLADIPGLQIKKELAWE